MTRANRAAGGVGNVARNCSRAGKRTASIHIRVACNRVINLQHTSPNIGITGVSVGSGQHERTRTNLRKRAMIAEKRVPHHAGKVGA